MLSMHITQITSLNQNRGKQLENLTLKSHILPDCNISSQKRGRSRHMDRGKREWQTGIDKERKTGREK